MPASPSARFLLPAALSVQALVLLPRIGLLPVWGDEQFTLDAVAAPMGTMLDRLRADFHPPLYFLFLKLWVALVPGPMPLVDEIRLASVALALAATVAVDRLWLRELPARLRRWFLLLWVLSPFLLLYARMGRSYTAQILVAAFAVRHAVDWARRPGAGTAVRFAVAESALLYVHYLPGLSVGAGFAAYGLYRIARAEREHARSLVVAIAVSAALYLPWMAPLLAAAGRRVGADVHAIVPHAGLAHALRLAYTFLSFTFGETMPLAGLLAAAALAPAIVWLLGHGALGSRHWLPVLVGALPVAYVLAAWHVVLPMTPSRLAFLLPFHLLLLVRGCERWPRVAALVLPGLLVTSAIAATSYHRQQDFLNRGYLIRFDAIATHAAASLSGGEVLFVIDSANMDATPLLAALPPAVPALVLHDDASSAAVRRRIDDGALRRVWLLRNTHDVSPGRWSSRLAGDLERSFRLARRSEYVPYGRVDRLAMRALGWPERPDYLLELLEFERGRRNGPPLPGERTDRRRPEVPPDEDVQRIALPGSPAEPGQVIRQEGRISQPRVLAGHVAPQEGVDELPVADDQLGLSSSTRPTGIAPIKGLPRSAGTAIG
jgi:hypothetical protein